MVIAISVPEIPATAAVGQLTAARDSVKAFHALGHTSWTYRHSLFANMGGFELQPSERHLVHPSTRSASCGPCRAATSSFRKSPTKDLLDKSKKYTVSKLITGFQVGCLIVQCIARSVQNLSNSRPCALSCVPS